ncbi:MAG: hypothetical protein KatS3mg050_4085 [Litorilinea sp.]|nr:MAG: hypothetical protein KatS3mg050_4085 [Litorilinea sp.]
MTPTTHHPVDQSTDRPADSPKTGFPPRLLASSWGQASPRGRPRKQRPDPRLEPGHSSPEAPCALAWRQPGTDRAWRGVVLVIHGLNLKPERMDGLVAELLAMDMAVLRLSLRGHGRNYVPRPGWSPARARLASFQAVNYGLWRAETYAAFCICRNVSQMAHVPLFLVAFSLGGLLACELAASGLVRFDGMVLLAPALRIRSWCRILQPLTPFPKLVIPSLSPSYYRANPGTPMAAYGALYQGLARLDRLLPGNPPGLQVPTLLWVDPDDEFVSYRGLRALQATPACRRWKLVPVQKSARAFPAYHHLIVDPAAVGGATWTAMVAQMRAHLLGRA